MVSVVNPNAGRWVVAVDAFRTPNGPVTYELVDAFTHPRFGVVAVLDSPEERAPAGRWTAQANTWTAETGPDSSRRLEARVTAKSRDVTAFTGAYGQGDRLPIPLGAAEVPLPAPSAAANR